jgi:hypothetical protein
MGAFGGQAAVVSQNLKVKAIPAGRVHLLLDTARATGKLMLLSVVAALLQVAHQVDLLDARVKQEQQSTLRTLQTLLTGGSPAEAAGADSIGAH